MALMVLDGLGWSNVGCNNRWVDGKEGMLFKCLIDSFLV